MADYIISDTTLTQIGDAVRGFASVSTIYPSEMIDILSDERAAFYSNISDQKNLISDLREALLYKAGSGSSAASYVSKVPAILERTLEGSFSDNRVTRLGSYALAGSNVSAVSFKNCTEISAFAFLDCAQLSIASMHGGRVDDLAFKGCNTLHTFIMKDDFSYTLSEPMQIASAAFEDCSALRHLIFDVDRVIEFEGDKNPLPTWSVYVPEDLIEVYASNSEEAVFYPLSDYELHLAEEAAALAEENIEE